MADWLAEQGVELVVCAGYMHLLTPAFLERFTAINVHPSLLPAFPGTTPIEDALAAGVAETGVTVHFVDEGVDTGPSSRRSPCRSSPGDTRGDPARAHPRGRAPPPARGGSQLSGRALYAPESRMQVGRALISVFDKTGLDVFARGLSDLGVEIVASGGTAAYIAELGIDVVPVEELTDVPELLGGRVKTLHPRIHAGILARRGLEADLDELASTRSARSTSSASTSTRSRASRRSRNVREEDAVEMIDIGGPALLRAAAKNFVDVVPVCDAGALRGDPRRARAAGGVRLDTRRRLAAEAFAHTAAYETSIAAWFADVETFPPRLLLSLEREQDARLRREPAPAGRLLRGGRRAAPPPLPRRPARRAGALVQQPQRPRRRAGRAAGVHAPGLRRSSSTRTRAAAPSRPRSRRPTRRPSPPIPSPPTAASSRSTARSARARRRASPSSSWRC